MSNLLFSVVKSRFVFIFSCLLFANIVDAKTIHSERSLYRNILVEEKRGVRCLKFNVRSSKTQQSCMLVENPDYLVFNYTKLLFSGLLVNSNPERILIIGLGGGTMSNTLHQIYPNATITNVEIDPAVIKVARQYFGFFENNNVTSVVQDGRIFIKRAALKKQQYDWIILDAFNGDYIPEHLMTQEFLQETKALLSDNGILTANTFSISRLYNYESATYQAVFGDFFNVRAGKTGNRIIVASNRTLPNSATLSANAKMLSPVLKPFGVDINHIMQQLKSTSSTQDWPISTQVLTDQYSPANLLNMK